MIAITPFQAPAKLPSQADMNGTLDVPTENKHYCVPTLTIGGTEAGKWVWADNPSIECNPCTDELYPGESRPAKCGVSPPPGGGGGEGVPGGNGGGGTEEGDTEEESNTIGMDDNVIPYNTEIKKESESNIIKLAIIAGIIAVVLKFLFKGKRND